MEENRADVMVNLMRARDAISDLKAIYNNIRGVQEEYGKGVKNDNLKLNNNQCILALEQLEILTDIMSSDVLADIDACANLTDDEMAKIADDVWAGEVNIDDIEDEYMPCYIDDKSKTN